MKQSTKQTQGSEAERRAHYEALAEALITMIDLEMQTAGRSPLRVADEHSEVEDDPLLIHAISNHFIALAHNLDWYDKRTIRKFYVALRLHDDELRAERQAAHAEWEKKAAGKGGREEKTCSAAVK